MQQFFVDYFERLERLHEDAKKTLIGLKAGQLTHAPGKDMNSLSVLAVHTAAAERFWIGDVALSDPSYRNRESEFQVTKLDMAELAEKLDHSLVYIRRGLESLTLEELGQTRTTPDGQKVTVGWCLEHVLAHTATHVGHMQLTRQFLELEK
jgi:uncharacterized damage-inducible protein DinB